MKNVHSIIYLISFILIVGCNHSPDTSKKSNDNSAKEKVEEISEEQIDHLGITNKTYLSAASKRALKWPKIGNEWFIEFSKPEPLKGDLAYESGVVRRDPSAMIKENGKYYVWYSKSTGPTQGFGGDIEKRQGFSLG